jgi:D-ornithine 4,5-aminomutase subunit beta
VRLDPARKLDIEELLRDLADYRPRRKGWTWREPVPRQRIGPFTYEQTSKPLERSVPLTAAEHFDGIDPQPEMVITTEIASGRFEDDVRRMRMAAWHGADHMMVIRTAGQSHIDGLLEGTPEGVGGVPITRKQVRATRKALDAIEDEVGRPINFHSYVSGVAGPEIAVMFAEEGVNGAHQDPQYNILYRGISPVRSMVDAAEAKRIMADARILQIDGAHNANATAEYAWKVMPELLVQHAINCVYSKAAGMEPDHIALSTVPPTAAPAPSVRLDLPYAVALRRVFEGYRFRAQQNTRYITADDREATVLFTLNNLTTRLTSADIQSTITPDEGRNVPWHQFNVAAVDGTKQALVGMDGLLDQVAVRDENVWPIAREIIERAVLFLEEIAEMGYFKAVEEAYFVDSGYYPEGVGDGIARPTLGGVAAGTVVPREDDYWAPVCGHFGHSEIPDWMAESEMRSGFEPAAEPCAPIGGCTLCDPGKIVFIDELDESDNVGVRLAERAAVRDAGELVPEAEWFADGWVTLSMNLPAERRAAEAAALEIVRKMGLADPEVIFAKVLHPAEMTMVELKARVPFAVDPASLEIVPPPALLSVHEVTDECRARGVKVVAATVGEDEHSVGLREILDIKHGGLEAYGIGVHYLGTSVPIEKLLDAAVEIGATAILMSTIIAHDDVHKRMMARANDLAVEKGVRGRFLIIAGGPRVTPEAAAETGIDAGFGRGTHGLEVASWIVGRLRERDAQGRPGGHSSCT